MKKTLFTVCAILTVCTVVFLACKKSDDKYNNDGTHRQVTYASQSTASSGGSGGNPNPNNNPSSSGYTTTGTSTTTTTSYGSFSDGTSHTFTGSTPCGSATMTGTYSGGTITITFASVPTAGTYSLVSSAPGASQAVMSAFGSSCTGSITVSGTSQITVTFTSVYYNTTNITGSLKCM
ncbi:MAG: hypothetical protein ACXVC6_00705 [Bacteroidia bacterium]